MLSAFIGCLSTLIAWTMVWDVRDRFWATVQSLDAMKVQSIFFVVLIGIIPARYVSMKPSGGFSVYSRGCVFRAAPVEYGLHILERLAEVLIFWVGPPDRPTLRRRFLAVACVSFHVSQLFRSFAYIGEDRGADFVGTAITICWIATGHFGNGLANAMPPVPRLLIPFEFHLELFVSTTLVPGLAKFADPHHWMTDFVTVACALVVIYQLPKPAVFATPAGRCSGAFLSSQPRCYPQA